MVNCCTTRPWIIWYWKELHFHSDIAINLKPNSIAHELLGLMKKNFNFFPLRCLLLSLNILLICPLLCKIMKDNYLLSPKRCSFSLVALSDSVVPISNGSLQGEGSTLIEKIGPFLQNLLRAYSISKWKSDITSIRSLELFTFAPSQHLVSE